MASYAQISKVPVSGNLAAAASEPGEPMLLVVPAAGVAVGRAYGRPKDSVDPRFTPWPVRPPMIASLVR
jgi:hypothetical protein